MLYKQKQNVAPFFFEIWSFPWSNNKKKPDNCEMINPAVNNLYTDIYADRHSVTLQNKIIKYLNQ